MLTLWAIVGNSYFLQTHAPRHCMAAGERRSPSRLSGRYPGLSRGQVGIVSPSELTTRPLLLCGKKSDMTPSREKEILGRHRELGSPLFLTSADQDGRKARICAETHTITRSRVHSRQPRLGYSLFALRRPTFGTCRGSILMRRNRET